MFIYSIKNKRMHPVAKTQLKKKTLLTPRKLLDIFSVFHFAPSTPENDYPNFYNSFGFLHSFSNMNESLNISYFCLT